MKNRTKLSSSNVYSINSYRDRYHSVMQEAEKYAADRADRFPYRSTYLQSINSPTPPFHRHLSLVEIVRATNFKLGVERLIQVLLRGVHLVALYSSPDGYLRSLRAPPETPRSFCLTNSVTTNHSNPS